jgi:hypothetical protein
MTTLSTTRSLRPMLNVHYALGAIVLIFALAALVNARARRLVQYVLALQIVVGLSVWFSIHVAPPPAHWILALVAGGVFAAANALERRGRPRGTVIAVSALGVVLVAYIYYLGMHAVRG